MRYLTTSLGPAARTLLRRVADAGLHDHWQLRDVCPLDAAQFLAALDALLDHGYAERVHEPRCRWHYRLTGEGRAVAGSPAG